MLRDLLALLFPPRCLACRHNLRHRLGLCRECDSQVVYHQGRGCIRCGRSRHRHGCVPQEHVYQTVLALAEYSGPWRKVVLAVKMGVDRETALALAAELAALCRTLAAAPPDMVVAAPGAGITRGRFDGVASVAAELARQLEVPFFRCLTRSSGRLPQVRLSRDQRLRGLDRHIRVEGAANLTDRRVWLVDDVFTTGGTADACARQLLEAGARSVSVIVMAN